MWVNGYFLCVRVLLMKVKKGIDSLQFLASPSNFSLLFITFFLSLLNIVWITILFSMHVYILLVEIKKQIDFLEFIKATYLLA